MHFFSRMLAVTILVLALCASAGGSKAFAQSVDEGAEGATQEPMSEAEKQYRDIAWQGPGQPVLMTGPAVTVFEGTIEL